MPWRYRQRCSDERVKAVAQRQPSMPLNYDDNRLLLNGQIRRVRIFRLSRQVLDYRRLAGALGLF